MTLQPRQQAAQREVLDAAGGTRAAQANFRGEVSSHALAGTAVAKKALQPGKPAGRVEHLVRSGDVIQQIRLASHQADPGLHDPVPAST